MNYEGSGHFNEASAIICIVKNMQIIVVLTTPCMIVFSFINKSKILNSDTIFFKKWGSLFYEFKNNKGFWSSQYYFVFFLRRLGFLLSQVYLNSYPNIQGGLNIFGSIVQTGFLIWYRPFKDNLILFSTTAGEVCTSLTMIFSFSFMFITSVKVSAYIESVTIFVILGGMGCQFAVTIFAFFKNIRLFYKRFEKYKIIDFMKSVNTVKTNNPTSE